MIVIKWSDKSLLDLERLYTFLASVNKSAAAQVIQSLTKAPNNLLVTPRIGERLPEFEPREIRRLFVGKYELRYEIKQSSIYILRIWHTKENR